MFHVKTSKVYLNSFVLCKTRSLIHLSCRSDVIELGRTCQTFTFVCIPLFIYGPKTKEYYLIFTGPEKRKNYCGKPRLPD